MRFWAGEASGWQGRVKTPGNISGQLAVASRSLIPIHPAQWS